MPFVGSRSRLPLLAALLLMTAFLSTALRLPAVAAAQPLADLGIALTYASAVSDNPTLVIIGRLPDDVPLPAQMILPLPEDASVMRAAEFFGDADREEVVVDGVQEVRDGAPVLVFTLTQSRVGIIDVASPALRSMVDGRDDLYEARLNLKMPVDVASVNAAIVLPPEGVAGVQNSEPVTVNTAEDGSIFHSITRSNMTAGEQLDFSMQVTYVTVPTVVDETIPWMVIAVIAVIIAALIVLIYSMQQARIKRQRDEAAGE